MKVNERVQYYRQQKGFSQEYLCGLLGLEQSQYSRRETGQVEFRALELERIAELLGVEIADFFADKATIFTSNNQSGGNFGQYFALPEKLIEQYEARLKEKDELIAFLRDEIKILRSKE